MFHVLRARLSLIVSLAVLSLALHDRARGADCNANGIPDDRDIANCDGSAWCGDCNSNDVPDICDVPRQGSGFTTPARWDTFDPSSHGVGVDPDGLAGSAYDGRYMYFPPGEHNRNQTGGEFLRYDTHADFFSAGSWEAYALWTSKAYDSAVFANGYVYFAPVQEGTAAGTRVDRFNVSGAFTSAQSWETFDASAVGALGGYRGIVFDDPFVYFVPNWDGGQPGKHGQVLRYDTTAAFDQPGSWEVFDPGWNDGYWGAVAAGDHIYFVPHHNNSAFFREVLRYNETLPFDDESSWETHTPSGQLPAPGNGYAHAVFDGAFVYFLPSARPETNAIDTVLRYNVSGAFTDNNSWETFEVPCGIEGFTGGMYDGQRYIYFSGGLDAPATGVQVRYDTRASLTDAASWACFDPGEGGVGVDPDGYHSPVSDGRFIFFAPFDNGSERHGEFLRYDTAGGASPDCDANRVPDECQPDCDSDGVPDACELPPLGHAADCNANDIPDSCELAGCTGVPACSDCNTNGMLDICDVASGEPHPFDDQCDLSTVDEPDAIYVADLNGDGLLDLLIGGDHSGDVAVYYAVAPCQFAPPVIYTISSISNTSQTGFDVGDYNVDGLLDFATSTNRYGNTVSILYGQPGGGFGGQYTVTVGSQPAFSAKADFDGDGVPDLAFTNVLDSSVSILRGLGDGTFAVVATLGVDDYPYGIAASDFNQDGIVDLVTANSVGGTVSVLIGTGNSQFQPAEHYPVGDGTYPNSGPYFVVVGRFNSDEWPDIAVTVQDDDRVVVLYGAPGGNFDPVGRRQDIATGDGPVGLTRADLNRDGFLDLAVANYLSDTVSLYFGRADGTFGDRRDLPTGDNPLQLALGDWENDGWMDIAASCYLSDTVAIHMNGGNWGASSDCDANGAPDDCQTVAEDPDGDLLIDPCDNCPTVYNPGQENTNGTGLGDACECPTLGACDDADVCTW